MHVKVCMHTLLPISPFSVLIVLRHPAVEVFKAKLSTRVVTLNTASTSPSILNIKRFVNVSKYSGGVHFLLYIG